MSSVPPFYCESFGLREMGPRSWSQRRQGTSSRPLRAARSPASNLCANEQDPSPCPACQGAGVDVSSRAPRVDRSKSRCKPTEGTGGLCFSKRPPFLAKVLSSSGDELFRACKEGQTEVYRV